MSDDKNSQNSLPTIGISQCLLGEQVRHNGGHMRFDWITESLSSYAHLKGVCPELEMGLGVPRPAMRLEYDPEDRDSLSEHRRLISLAQKGQSSKDYTELALQTSNRLVDEMMGESGEDFLSGFILAKKSPSCGVERVKVYNAETGIPDQQHQGLFAQKVVERNPYLPVIDSGRLHDADEREDFIKRVVAYHRYHRDVHSLFDLQTFHQRYKYILMEYDQKKVSQLGRLASSFSKSHTREAFESYRREFFELLKVSRPSKKSRKNVFLHLFGYFKNDLASEDKEHFLQMLEEFDRGQTPYMALVKMLEFFVRKYQKEYLQSQYFFSPFPKELGLQMHD